MNLFPMFAGCLLVAILGNLAAQRPQDRQLLWLAGALAIAMAVERGYYWNLFGRGHGFFTLNRTSALIVFIVLLIGPTFRWKRASK